MATRNSIGNYTGSLSINGAYSLPTSDGTANYVMTTNGSGTASWVTTATVFPSGSVLQTVTSTVSTVQSITATIPFDNTIPQSNEGTELTNVTLTPQSSSNHLSVTWYVAGTADNGNNISVAVTFFQDSGTDAIFSGLTHAAQTSAGQSSGKFVFTAGTTSATTIKMRIGVSTGTFYVNGDSSGTGLFGGTLGLTLAVQEIKV